jgi:hypothetical protein
MRPAITLLSRVRRAASARRSGVDACARCGALRARHGARVDALVLDRAAR